MKYQTQNTGQAQSKGSRLLLTGCILTSVAGGWLLGSFTTEAFSQEKNTENTIASTLFSIPVGGEKLPTVMLKEFSVVAN